MRGRSLAGVLGACAALAVGTAPLGSAQESTSSTQAAADHWEGTKFTDPGEAPKPKVLDAVPTDPIPFTAVVTYTYPGPGTTDASGALYGLAVADIAVEAGGPGPAGEDCADAVLSHTVSPAPSPLSPGPFTITGTLDEVDCNGRYTVDITATTFTVGYDGPTATKTITATFDVAEAPGPARDLEARADAKGRKVALSWDEPADGEAPDFAGYLVERRLGDGDWTEAGAAPAGTTSFVDPDPPAEGGKVTYRVVAGRWGPEEAFIRATGTSPTRSVTVSPATTTTDSTAPPPTGSGNPGSPDAGGGPQLRTPGVNNPRGSLTPPRPTTNTTLDTGFNERLPYEAEPGAEDPVLPGDEFASLDYEEGGRGLAVPAASAMVLAVWALHLRYLARAASTPE